MKKLICILCIIAVTTALAGCSSSSKDSPKPTDTQEEPVVSKGRYGSYYDFILNKSNGKDNAVFSPESLCSAFYVYSGMLTDESKTAIRDYLENINYLSYKNTDVFKTVNRIWVNSEYDGCLKNTEVADYAYYMDMTNSKAATDEKNSYVDEQTDHFIDSTPSVLSKDILCDVMNVTYFKDKWKSGPMTFTDNTYDFHNSDGTITQVKFLKGFMGDLYAYGNAHAFETKYADGFHFVAILPDEGYSLSDINIDAFISGEAEKVNAKCKFLMPEFETKTDYECKLKDFGLKKGMVDPSVYRGQDLDETIYLTTKIKVDSEGTEAAAVSEIVMTIGAAAKAEPEIYKMTCDRPFAYYIYDTENQDVAFIGIVNHIDG